jgi:hypothetical protein
LNYSFILILIIFI